MKPLALCDVEYFGAQYLHLRCGRHSPSLWLRAVRCLPTRIVQFRPGGFRLGGSAWAEAFGRAGLSGWHASALLGALIVTITHSIGRRALINTGNKDIITQEYNHNYLYFNGETIGKNYELSIDFDPEFNKKTQGISYNNRKFTFDQNVRHVFFCEDRTACVGKIASWELVNKAQRLLVKESLLAPLWKFAVFGKSYAICPELFADIKAPAGKTFTWQRKWVFEKEV